jgi:hypothetical protein
MMTKMRTTTIRTGLLGLAAASLVATVSAGTMFRLEVGPPVAAGTNYKLKGAVFVVRALVCDDLEGARVTATAEGIVNGSRQSVPLRLLPVNTPGVYAVERQWPVDGHWVVHLEGTCPSPKAAASTIVPMRQSTFIREKTKVMVEPATRKQIDAALADLQRTES